MRRAALCVLLWWSSAPAPAASAGGDAYDVIEKCSA
eukprot:gene10183-4700_t